MRFPKWEHIAGCLFAGNINQSVNWVEQNFNESNIALVNKTSGKAKL